MNKRIITWKSSNGELYTRGFIFGGCDSYVSSYDKLIDEAMKDFPYLIRDIIDISKVSNSMYMKGFIVISFALPSDTTHRDYDLWNSFDFNY